MLSMTIRKNVAIDFNETIYRYVCPRCLRTFVSNEYHEDWICWGEGELLEVVPKRVVCDES